jgi:hypothetical protein
MSKREDEQLTALPGNRDDVTASVIEDAEEVYCKHCDYEGPAMYGYQPRPSRKMVRLCPSCHGGI